MSICAACSANKVTHSVPYICLPRESFHLQIPAEPLATRRYSTAARQHFKMFLWQYVLQFSSKFSTFKYIPDKSYINLGGSFPWLFPYMHMLRNTIWKWFCVGLEFQVSTSLGGSQTVLRRPQWYKINGNDRQNKKSHSLMDEALRMKGFLKK